MPVYDVKVIDNTGGLSSALSTSDKLRVVDNKNIDTKDIKIFMHKKNDKVKVKSKQ